MPERIVHTCHAFSQSRRCPADPIRAPVKAQTTCVKRSLYLGVLFALGENEKALIHSDSSRPRKVHDEKNTNTERYVDKMRVSRCFLLKRSRMSK
jgi:ribosomal protein L13E